MDTNQRYFDTLANMLLSEGKEFMFQVLTEIHDLSYADARIMLAALERRAMHLQEMANDAHRN